MAVTTALLPSTWVQLVQLARARLKAALLGIEKLTDAEAAAYLNAHPGAIERIPSMPTTITAEMVDEARKS